MGSLICTVELDKEKGVKVTIVDRDAEVTQSIAMDGATIVLSMKKGGAETSVTQTESSVTVRCKDFEVAATGTIKLASDGASTWSSKDVLGVRSTGELSVKSDAKVSGSAPAIDLVAANALSLSGAASKAALGAQGASVEGTPKCTLKAPMVEVAAEAAMKLESSGVALVKGAIVNVQGSLVNVG